MRFTCTINLDGTEDEVRRQLIRELSGMIDLLLLTDSAGEGLGKMPVAMLDSDNNLIGEWEVSNERDLS